jgi:hypothetical protein
MSSQSNPAGGMPFGSPEVQLPNAVTILGSREWPDRLKVIDVYACKLPDVPDVYVASKRKSQVWGREGALVYGPLPHEVVASPHPGSLEAATGSYRGYDGTPLPSATIETALYGNKTRPYVGAFGAVALLAGLEGTTTGMLDGMQPAVRQIVGGESGKDREIRKDLGRAGITQRIYEGKDGGLAVVHYSSSKADYGEPSVSKVSYAACAVPGMDAVRSYASALLGSGTLNMLPSVSDPVNAALLTPLQPERYDEVGNVLASLALILRQDKYSF